MLKGIKDEIKALNMREIEGEENEVRRVSEVAFAGSHGSPVSSSRREAQTPPEKEKERVNSPIKGDRIDVAEIEAELKRLEIERAELVATGVFDEYHHIIIEMDKRMNAKAVELSRAASLQ